MLQRVLGVRTPDIGALRERRGSGTFLSGKKREKDAPPHIFFVIRECPWEKPVHIFSSLSAFMQDSTYTTSSRHRPKLQYIFMQLRRIVVSTFNVSLLHNRPYFISKRLCAQRREVVTTEGRLSREYTLPGEFNLQPPKYQKS